MKAFGYKGYFLIEILIVLTIILLISTIVIPNFNFLNEQILASDLERLNVVFAYMQQSAIAKNKSLILKFDDSKTYSYDNFKDRLSKNNTFGILPGVKGPPSTPTHILTNPINFHNNQVIFYSNGQIQPGTIYLTDNVHQYALTIPISQVSFIRKYKLTNGKWELI